MEVRTIEQSPPKDQQVSVRLTEKQRTVIYRLLVLTVSIAMLTGLWMWI
ncbi:MAG: hypothetical protein HC847_25705 [Hydrococcus sp. RU_2_2]|jgi:hypothetical protein|nr:hypothetical protein [Hydrococcus sp. RU_2_2]NJP21710.1 hypothetical protein [Hydrococcus sp. CRU_1_1]NJQ97023.1 hypothetical protein [Hydrococcus sp. CSU_1_8]